MHIILQFKLQHSYINITLHEFLKLIEFKVSSSDIHEFLLIFKVNLFIP